MTLTPPVINFMMTIGCASLLMIRPWLYQINNNIESIL